jgi:cell division topological specificity factor
MAREDRWDKLHADVPVKRQKIAFEWDPPSYTSSIRGKIHVEVEREER